MRSLSVKHKKTLDHFPHDFPWLGLTGSGMMFVCLHLSSRAVVSTVRNTEVSSSIHAKLVGGWRYYCAMLRLAIDGALSFCLVIDAKECCG